MLHLFYLVLDCSDVILKLQLLCILREFKISNQCNLYLLPSTCSNTLARTSDTISHIHTITYGVSCLQRRYKFTIFLSLLIEIMTFLVTKLFR